MRFGRRDGAEDYGIAVPYSRPRVYLLEARRTVVGKTFGALQDADGCIAGCSPMQQSAAATLLPP
jgi:hypothetical protein